MQSIIEVMQKAETPLHLHQIVNQSKQPEHVVRAFIREQSSFEYVEMVPTRGRYGNRYKWNGPVENGADIDAACSNIANELAPLPSDLSAEPELLETTEPPVTTKIGYMITAAKGKIERRKTHEAAKRLAGSWAKNGHKNVMIHLTSEQERVRVKPEIQFERAW